MLNWMSFTTLPPFPEPRRPESWQPLYWAAPSQLKAAATPGVTSGPGNQGTAANLPCFHQSGTAGTQLALPRNLAAQSSSTGTI